jgi:hypothetical protein
MRRSLPILVLGSLCVVSIAQATTYVRVEKDGTKTYSDRPIPGGEPIDLKPAQGYSAPPPSGISSRPRDQEPDNFSYQSCSVTPANDSTFTNPETVSISLATNPGLRSRDTVIMTVDGQAVGQPGTVSYTMAAPVNRGTHTVSVTITDQHGRTVCSVSSQFHVMHPGLNSPAAPNRSGPPPPRPSPPRPTPH